MPRLRLPTAWTERLRAFRDERKAVAAVEFAFIAPVLVTLYVGAVDLSYSMTADRKVTQSASTVADLVAQAGAIDDNGIANVFRAGQDVMRPYPLAGLGTAITLISFDGSNNPRPSVTWAEAQGRARRTVPPTIPAGLATPNGALVFVEVSYNFTPPARFFMPNGETYQRALFLRPRVGTTVERMR